MGKAPDGPQEGGKEVVSPLELLRRRLQRVADEVLFVARSPDDGYVPEDKRLRVCSCPVKLGWDVKLSGHHYNCPLFPKAEKDANPSGLLICSLCTLLDHPHMHGSKLFTHGKEVF